MSNDEGMKTGGAAGRRPTTAPLSPLENEGTLSEILLRLPPAPSALLRASLVCKLWRRLVSHPGFLRRFRARHRRNPPLLGFFVEHSHGLYFEPDLEPPDRVPSHRFSFPPMDYDDDDFFEWRSFKLREELVLSCRDGLVLRLHRLYPLVQVWDPLTGDVSRIFIPLEFNSDSVVGEVLRAVSEVNADGYLGHFHVVLLATDINNSHAFVSVYSSETGVWGNAISIACGSIRPLPTPGTLIRRSLYWSLHGEPHCILEFDLDRQSLSVIDVQLLSSSVRGHIWIMPLDGVVGCLFQSFNNKIELWKRSAGYDGAAGWVLERSLKLNEIPPPFKLDELPPMYAYGDTLVKIVGIDVDNYVFFLRTKIGAFKIHVESLKCKKVSEMSSVFSCHSFTGVCTAGLGTCYEEN